MKGEQFEDPLEDTAEDFGHESITEHFEEDRLQSLEDAFEEVEEVGYRTIVFITDRPAMIEIVAKYAEEYDLLGPDFLWVVSGAAFPPALESTLKFEVDSPADKLLRGAALFTNYDSFVYNGESDSFLKAWRKQDSSLVERLNQIVPLNQNGEKYFVGEASYFQTETPTEYASFMYDSIIATGIGACHAQSSGGSVDHYNSIMESEFFGASGMLTFNREVGDGDGDEDDKPGFKNNARSAEGPLFGVYNVRPGPVEVVDGKQMRGYVHRLALLVVHVELYSTLTSFSKQLREGIDVYVQSYLHGEFVW